MNTKIQIEEFLDLIKKLPGATDFFNRFSTVASMFSTLQLTIPNDFVSNKNVSDKEVQNYFYKITKMLEEADNEVMKVETRKKYEMRTFKFDINKVLAHSRLIDKVSNRIYYLNYLLKEYSAHELLRINKVNDVFNNELKINPDFYNELLSALIFMVNNKDNDDKLLMFKLDPGFREQIISELNYLNSLNEDSMVELLDEINNPPGTRKRFTNEKETLDDHNDEYMTTKEICEYLKISKSTFYNYRNENNIKSFQMGRNVRYKKSDIIGLLKKR